MLLYFVAEQEPQVLFTVHSEPHMVTEYSFSMEFLLLYHYDAAPTLICIAA